MPFNGYGVFCQTGYNWMHSPVYQQHLKHTTVVYSKLLAIMMFTYLNKAILYY